MDTDPTPKTRPISLSPPPDPTTYKRLRPISHSLTPTPECWDWLLTPGNTHYSRSLQSFTRYTPLDTPVKLANTNPTDPDSSDEVTVSGIGTAELPVVRGVDGDDGGAVNVLVLENVLFIPDAICNGFNPVGFGGWMRCEGGLVVGGRDGGGGDGAGVGWFARAFAGGFRVEIADGKCGGSEVVEGGEYRFGVWVSDREWEAILGAAGVGRVNGGVDGMVE